MPTIHNVIKAHKMSKRPPKVPPINQWKKTPKERGRRQGHVWDSSLSATGQFFIFANPNKPSQGPIKDFYITDGQSIIAQGYRVRSDALKGLRLHLKQAMHDMLGVSSGQRVNPLNKKETEIFEDRERRYLDAADDQITRMEQSDDPRMQGIHQREADRYLGHSAEAGYVARNFGAHRANPEVVQAPRSVNPLTDQESAEILQTTDLNRSEGHRRHAAGNEAGGHHAIGMADGQRSIVTQYGPADAGARHVQRKRQRNPRPKLAPGELSASQRAMLKRLAKGAISKKEKLALPDRSVLGALARKGLISDLKTMWKIRAKGLKAIGSRANPKSTPKKVGATPRGHAKRKKATPRKAAKRPARKNPKTEICRHTMPLEKGSRAKLTVCFPRACFSSLKKAVLDIQRELRVQFGRLSKAPVITRAEWKWSDKAKTKGRWHFKGKKR